MNPPSRLQDCKEELYQEYDHDDVDRLTKLYPYKSCFGNYVFLRELGFGTQNVVYEVCKEDDCNRVLKFTSSREARYAKEFGDKGIAPHVFNIITCESEEEQDKDVALVMEKYDGSLQDLYPFSDTHCYVIDQLLDLLYKTIVRSNVIHRDITISNVLFKYEDHSEDKTIHIAISDWELAENIPTKDRTKEKYAEYFVESVNNFVLSYMRPEEYSPDREFVRKTYRIDKREKFKIFSCLDKSLKKYKSLLEHYPLKIYSAQDF